MKTSPGTIHKAISLLRCFSSETPQIGVRELAARVKMPRSTVQRLLAALEEEGLVEQDPDTQNYLLGSELVVLAGLALAKSNVRRVALPYMMELASRWNESVDLDVLRGDHIIIIEQIPGRHILNTGGTFAMRMPAYCTSTGKVLLAYSGREYIEANIPEKLRTITQNTITTRSQLIAELEKVRQQGWARSWGENEDFVHAVAVPIWDRSGKVIAAMSISGLDARIDEATAAEIAQSLKDTCSHISARLGYVAPVDQLQDVEDV